MSGGNLGRSRSLLDVARRPIGSSPSSVGPSSSTGTARTGADPGQQHPYLSRSLADLTGGNEEEGLASLGDKTSVNDVPESQGTTAEIDHSILDYDDEPDHIQDKVITQDRPDLPLSTLRLPMFLYLKWMHCITNADPPDLLKDKIPWLVSHKITHLGKQ
jgi:hypothetical protein